MFHINKRQQESVQNNLWQVTHLMQVLLEIALWPTDPALRVKLADRWRVSLRLGEGLDTRIWWVEPSKCRRYEDILSVLRLMMKHLLFFFTWTQDPELVSHRFQCVVGCLYPQPVPETLQRNVEPPQSSSVNVTTNIYHCYVNLVFIRQLKNWLCYRIK